MPHVTMKSQWITNLERKFLEENKGEKSCDLGSGQDFCDTTPAKWIHWISSNIKNLCSLKDTRENKKSSHKQGENVCNSYV